MLENPGRKSDNLQLAHLVSYLAGYLAGQQPAWPSWLEDGSLGRI